MNAREDRTPRYRMRDYYVIGSRYSDRRTQALCIDACIYIASTEKFTPLFLYDNEGIPTPDVSEKDAHVYIEPCSREGFDDMDYQQSGGCRCGTKRDLKEREIVERYMLDPAFAKTCSEMTDKQWSDFLDKACGVIQHRTGNPVGRPKKPKPKEKATTQKKMTRKTKRRRTPKVESGTGFTIFRRKQKGVAE